MYLTRFASLCGLLAASSCMNNPTGPVCRDPTRIDPLPGGIQVQVRDSVTLQDVLAGTKVVARQSATVADSVTATDIGAVWVGKVNGTYTLTVTRAGYQTWSRANVDVESDVCGFIPVQITALLQP